MHTVQQSARRRNKSWKLTGRRFSWDNEFFRFHSHRKDGSISSNRKHAKLADGYDSFYLHFHLYKLCAHRLCNYWDGLQRWSYPLHSTNTNHYNRANSITLRRTDRKDFTVQMLSKAKAVNSTNVENREKIRTLPHLMHSLFLLRSFYSRCVHSNDAQLFHTVHRGSTHDNLLGWVSSRPRRPSQHKVPKRAQVHSPTLRALSVGFDPLFVDFPSSNRQLIWHNAKLRQVDQKVTFRRRSSLNQIFAYNFERFAPTDDHLRFGKTFDWAQAECYTNTRRWGKLLFPPGTDGPTAMASPRDLHALNLRCQNDRRHRLQRDPYR